MKDMRWRGKDSARGPPVTLPQKYVEMYRRHLIKKLSCLDGVSTDGHQDENGHRKVISSGGTFNSWPTSQVLQSYPHATLQPTCKEVERGERQTWRGDSLGHEIGCASHTITQSIDASSNEAWS